VKRLLQMLYFLLNLGCRSSDSNC